MCCPNDETFLQSFDHSNDKAKQLYPPVALLENVSDAVIQSYKIRRLHLGIVDLWRPWKVNQKQVKSQTDLLRRLEPSSYTDGTTPMMPCTGVSSLGKSPLHCKRFVYGYSLDDSDFPCYFLWPHRTQEDNFWLLEFQTRRYVDLSGADFLQALGIRHFYDAWIEGRSQHPGGCSEGISALGRRFVQ